MTDVGRRWRFDRALARIEPIVEPILVDHATGYWMRPLRRVVLDPATGGSGYRAVWTIDDEPVLELRFAERGPSTVVVHDFSVFTPVRHAIRTRHVRVRLASVRDVVAVRPPARFTAK